RNDPESRERKRAASEVQIQGSPAWQEYRTEHCATAWRYGCSSVKDGKMRNRLTPLIMRGLLALLLAVATCGAYAQDSTRSDKNKSPDATTPPADQSYSVSLATGQVIPLSPEGADQGASSARAPATQPTRLQLLYGGTVSAVYMDNYAPASIEN